jgi:hypothetical protein
MAKKEDKCEHHHCTPRCMGMKLLILGVLIGLKEMYYPGLAWAYFIGGIIALKGLIHLVMPKCCCKK